MQMKGRFLGLMAIGNQATDEIDQKVERAAMVGVFDQKDVVELVVDGFADGTMAQQQLVGQRHQAVLHPLFEFGDELHTLFEQLLEHKLGYIAPVAEEIAEGACHQPGQYLDISSVARRQTVAQQLAPIIDDEMQFEAENQPMLVLPRAAIPANTLCCLMRRLSHTEIGVASTKLMPVQFPKHVKR